MSKPKCKDCSSLRCEVCASLLKDSDWRITAGGSLQRGSIRVYPAEGEIEQNGSAVPLGWLERRCVKMACRKRAEKLFRVYKFMSCEQERKAGR